MGEQATGGHAAKELEEAAVRRGDERAVVVVAVRARARELRRGRREVERRAADGAGLEEMFLQLTADTQREAA